ncbi:bifunctional proline dehydrogenase/L-glutamate gamma-semialdehyde dehydrogenase PutA [Catenovulum sp. SM1970]|uniref:bifunctional proline dehydrogenase/L-glutamate gamma-semialdehyde dehydrogenase PutA n=1 Tax=Marinifaba aquimaris TaxID=2741323 RepID=UPI001573DF93|nr:bifunctional proline dehydrogenase/L-glutamate gamma-semialdehyde dehydrogenase PutA [Marinifaba aquimaris]NTS77185.1 bifunctional proline dehydrogenase/L-glutamate gamma-semialdehyde dehydrogenase PutA [Marinifaba aquimaris]
MFKASQVLTDGYQLPSLNELKSIISHNYCVDESAYLAELSQLIKTDEQAISSLTRSAEQLIAKVREKAQGGDGIDAFLQQYSLDTEEGIILMCLAEALLRIPDSETADSLIKDKLNGADWEKHLKSSDSLLVNASTWGLMLTGKVINLDSQYEKEKKGLMGRMLNRLGEPVVRNAMYTAMKIMGKQFVLGRDIEEALKTSKDNRKVGYTHSYDMLGEAALTQADAAKYLQAYRRAIESIGQQKFDESDAPRPSISIKLSALHPRYEEAQREGVLNELAASLIGLIELARSLNVSIQIDAEEADRLELSLDLFAKVYRSEAAKGWGQLGLVVQAYSKRALPVLMWITQLAKEQGDLIPLRLVKGAYWDSEIKLCQQMGIAGYPVYTRKAGTDLSYLACAQFLLSEHTKGVIYPQFATHNAHTVVAINAVANGRDYEFQRLHGMGDDLYNTVLEQNTATNCRIYAPVGAHKDLLPYLVRRLLENGANSSFVHKLIDPKEPVGELAEHPYLSLKKVPSFANDKIKLPANIFVDRTNSKGDNLHIEALRTPFFDGVDKYKHSDYFAAPVIASKTRTSSEPRAVLSPQAEAKIGDVYFTTPAEAQNAINTAYQAYPEWRDTPVETRAACLDKLADLLEKHSAELIALCNQEAGKTLQDCIDEVREAVDFCRYYAVQARALFEPQVMPGPTGETNTLYALGRGVFVCVSPWNFPLAIFLGQVTAALVTGNAVLAKPAEQTSLIAHRAVDLCYQAGIPKNVLQFVPGVGRDIGDTLTSDSKIAGVCFTGSTGTAKHIQHVLANKAGAIAPLIAETGGQNAMIVDSTALPEQVVSDVVSSAFASAGQRCSALRVLFVQKDIAPRVEELLKGAMAELKVGDPALYSTDVGPVIDATAKEKLMHHINQISMEGELIYQTNLSVSDGYFVPPTAVRIDSIEQLDQEHFGPILHVVHYAADELQQVIDSINNTGFGLTLGIHSRNETFADYVARNVNVGNVYINRNQIGAVVGVQPFGGQGLSGTGPKAGGPHYLSRFITEKTISNNITAIGGNASLLALGDG